MKPSNASCAALGLGLMAALVVSSAANSSPMRGALDETAKAAAPVRVALPQPVGPVVELPNETPWQVVPLWRGEGFAVAVATEELGNDPAGHSVASVGHALATGGRAAAYTSETFGAEWQWRVQLDESALPSPGSMHFLPSGRFVAGGLGRISGGYSIFSAWGASALPAGFHGSHAHQIAFSRVVGSTVLIAVRGYYEESPGGILQSSHHGVGTWDITPPFLEGHDATAVAMHATDSNRLAAATVSGAGLVSLVESTDMGETWQPISAGLPTGHQVKALTYVGDQLLAALDGRGVFRRAAGGGWTPVGGGAPALRAVNRLHVSYADPQTVLAATAQGLSVSHDGGTHWRHAIGGTVGHDVRDVATGPLDTDVVLLAVAGVGVMASVDGGASFEVASHGISDAQVGAVSAHPENPLRLVATVLNNGRWRMVESFDGGSSWVMLRSVPIDVSQVWFGPDGTLWARTDGEGAAATLHQRRANGTWRRVGFDAAEASGLTLSFDAGLPELAWIGGAARVHGDLRAVAWRSEDGGATWARAWVGPVGHTVASVSVVPGSQGQHVLVSTDRQHTGIPAQLHFSLNGGQNWQAYASIPTGFDWKVIELCTHADNGGTAQLLLRYDPQEGQRASTSTYTLEQIGSGGESITFSGAAWGALRAPVCRQEADALRVYALDSDLNHNSTTVVRTNLNGRLVRFGQWAHNAKQPTLANALAFNDAGVFLASNRGLYRNTAPIQNDAPQITAANSVDGRAQRIVTLAWTAGGEWVDVLRDGEVAASVRNTGSYSERLLRDGSGPEYQVCNRFGEGCSEPVTLAP